MASTDVGSRRKTSRSRRAAQPGRPHRGFTLVEILVVIAIILLTSIIALPTLMTAANGRQVVDCASILQAALAGVRDAATKDGQPRGIRLMPDPTMTIPALGQPNAGTLQLAFNRIVYIEQAAEYNVGKVTVGPQLPVGSGTTGFPPPYPVPLNGSAVYPYPPSGSTPLVLMIEESPFQGGYVSSFPGTLVPNEPTNWYWNIRLGDKIKVNSAGRSYTVVGPCTINPWTTGVNKGNPELFVNVGTPGTASPLQRAYYVNTPTGISFSQNANPEFLFLVNGDDDNKDGFVDSGWDGFDNTPATGIGITVAAAGQNGIDELAEWEQETWEGALSNAMAGLTDTGAGPNSPTAAWVGSSNNLSSLQDSAYGIERRPMPTPSARETALPGGVVIDATTWNWTKERSRLPVDPASLTVDVVLNPNGQFVPTTVYSSPTSTGANTFLHFWIADRNDVYPRGAVWGTGSSGPNPNPSNTATATYYELPMTEDAVSGSTPGPGFYPPSGSQSVPVLKNDRRLLTLFGRNGLVVTNTIDSIPAAATSFFPGEGFNVLDVNQPFYRAQLGLKEVR